MAKRSEAVRRLTTRERLLLLETAVNRYFGLLVVCDYHDDPEIPPLKCPGRIKGSGDYSGGWCHWCQMRGALLGIDDPEGPVLAAAKRGGA